MSTLVLSPLLKMSGKPRYPWMVMERTSLCTFSFDQTSSSASGNLGEAPISSESGSRLGLPRAGPPNIFYTGNSIPWIGGCWFLISSVCHDLQPRILLFSHTSYISTQNICHSWNIFLHLNPIYTGFESGMASWCLLKSSQSLRCISETTPLPERAKL